MTGVPHAMDSTRLKPNGSSKLIKCSSAKARLSTSARRAGPTDPTYSTEVTVEVGLDARIKVVLVLNDAGDDQLDARALRHLDGFKHALVRMDSTEEQEILSVAAAENGNCAISMP